MWNKSSYNCSSRRQLWHQQCSCWRWQTLIVYCQLAVVCFSGLCRSNFLSWHWTCFVYCKLWNENLKKICQTSSMILHRLPDALLLYEFLHFPVINTAVNIDIIYIISMLAFFGEFGVDMYPRIDILRISAILMDTDRIRIVISLFERIWIRILCYRCSTDVDYALILFYS